LRDHIRQTREKFAEFLAPLKKAAEDRRYGTSIGATVFTYQ